MRLLCGRLNCQAFSSKFELCVRCNDTECVFRGDCNKEAKYPGKVLCNGGIDRLGINIEQQYYRWPLEHRERADSVQSVGRGALRVDSVTGE